MVVIADDITGAAEIAGIAFSKGQEVRLLCGTAAADSDCPVHCGTAAVTTTVIATDTRSMSEAEAVAETKRITSSLLTSRVSCLIFKKTDSALRGHVVAELEALMQATGCQRCVYLPANPSKGRIIRNGVYYIKEVSSNGQEVREVPIAETAFSYDPEFPAKTSVLKERFPDAQAKGIIMPDAESEDDIRRIVAEYNDGKTLFAGAADLFSAMLGDTSNYRDSGNSNNPSKTSALGPCTLILCGSTQSKPLELGIPIAQMPREVYDGEQGADYWFSSLSSSLFPLTSLILTIPHTHRTGKEVAVHLRTVMAEMAKKVVEMHRPDHLIIEGGATAWATLQTLGWTQFQIVCQIAPGVVQMRSQSGTLVTLKPGSYSWGGLMG